MAGSIQPTSQALPFSVRKANDTTDEEPKRAQASPVPTLGAEEPDAAGAITPDREAVNYLVDALNNMSRVVDRNLNFEVDDQTGRIIIRVTDGATGEVIREIPPEDVGKSSRDSLGQLVGLIFDGVS